MASTVIDVGYSQGEFDWDSAAGQIDGAIIEAGFGSNTGSQDDVQFARNVAECERLGIPWGAYLYSYASDDGMANSEADHILRLIDGHSPQLPLFIDVEENNLQGFAHRACEVFCQRIQDAGYTAGFYSGRAYANGVGLGDLPWFAWIAEYGSDSCNFDGNLSAWQYTNSGVMGVDTSYWYSDIKNGIVTGEEDMPITDEDAQKIAGAVASWQSDVGTDPNLWNTLNKIPDASAEKVAEFQSDIGTLPNLWNTLNYVNQKLDTIIEKLG